MHPVVKRYLNVAIDGLVQAAVTTAVVAILGAVMAAALLILGHFHGAWSDRVIGVIVGIAFVPLAVFALKLVRLKRSSADALLGIPKGFLDYKFEAESALAALPLAVGRLTTIMEDVGNSINRHTSQLQRAQSASAHKQLKVSQAASRSLDRHSSRMEKALTRLTGVESSLSEGLNGWSVWMEKTHVTNLPSELIVNMGKAADGTLYATDMLQQYVDATNGNRGTSQMLNAAIDRHICVVEEIRQTNLRIRAAFAETLQRFQGMLNNADPTADKRA